jgi:hypothetical protein
MEVYQKYMIVMTRDGRFQKAVPIKDTEIGSETEYRPLNWHTSLFFHPRRRLSKPFRIFALATLILILVIPFYFLIGEEETYAYVNVDVNPSIELEIDRSLLVNSLLPLNKEAKEIVDGLDGFQHEHLETVIEMIMHESEDTGLINEGKHMLVGISYTGEEHAENASILDHLKRYMIQENPTWKVAAFKVPEKIRQEARKINKPMNEVMATTVSEIEESDSLAEEDKAIINSFYQQK